MFTQTGSASAGGICTGDLEGQCVKEDEFCARSEGKATLKV